MGSSLMGEMVYPTLLENNHQRQETKCQNDRKALQ